MVTLTFDLVTPNNATNYASQWIGVFERFVLSYMPQSRTPDLEL